MDKLEIRPLVLGMMPTNGYLVKNRETGELLLIDPAAEAQRIVSEIEQMQGKPAAILLTHGHFDHIGAVEALREQYRIPVYALDAEQEVLEDPVKNLTQMIRHSAVLKADHFLHDGQELELAGAVIQVLHTPGHTAGSACYYLPGEGVLFSGDTLFCCSVGRTDFPTGSGALLHDSIHRRLFALPDGTRVLPGHNEETTIGYEKKYNPY